MDNKKEHAEDIYERLLDSQISYMIFEDPLEHYTHLTNEEKKKVKDYIMDDTHLWDYAPIAEFITDNIPTTFQKQNFENLGIKFHSQKYKNGEYNFNVEYRLYQHYLLNFEYGIGNTPVCFGEFVSNELQSDDYLEVIDGIEI